MLIITVRMFSTQPPAKASTITSAGRIPCRIALVMNGQFGPGVTLLSYAWLIGNQPSFRPRKYTTISPVKYAGNAPSAMKTGTKTVSKPPPRRHAATMPIAVPSTNAIANATPTRMIEYGSVRPTTSDTFDG